MIWYVAHPSIMDRPTQTAQAINGFLEGTPLTLESGFVQSVIARIPWPNPLTSTIGLSVQSLHLKFRISKTLSRPQASQGVDLADSVLSVAETFVHEELIDQEDVGLWTTQVESDDSNIPGGLDPFTPNEDDLHLDPAGVSLFATLIERLLARFEFDAQDIQISVTDDDNLTLRFTLSEIQYATVALGDAASGEIKRSLKLQGFEVHTTNHALRRAQASPSTTRPMSPDRDGNSGHNSPRSSSSSMDEETEMNMSQSIAMLPPRPISPTESESSSIYHSVVEGSQVPGTPWPDGETRQSLPTDIRPDFEERLLSFGSTPICIYLTTPSPTSGSGSSEKFNVDIGVGMLAIAVSPWQVLGIGRLLDKLSMNDGSSRAEKPASDRPSSGYSVDVDFRLRSITILFVPSSLEPRNLSAGISQYFSRPLPPPILPVGSTRLLIDEISCHAAASASSISATATISDISAFQFDSQHPDQDISQGQSYTIPLLITDPYLPGQYDQTHSHSPHDTANLAFTQPRVTTINWKDEIHARGGTRLSHWRSRPRSGRTPSEQSEKVDHTPAVKLSFQQTAQTRHKKLSPAEQSVRLDIAPLHVFIDLEMAYQDGGLLAFARDLSIEQQSYAQCQVPDETPSPMSSTFRDGDSSDDDEPQRDRRSRTEKVCSHYGLLSPT